MSTPTDDPYAPPAVDPRPDPVAVDVAGAQVFVLDERGVAAIGRRLRDRTRLVVGLLAIAMAIASWVSYQPSRSAMTSLIVAAVPTAAVVIIAFQVSRQHRRLLETFRSYQLAVYPDRVVRHQADMPDASVTPRTLKSLVEGKNGMSIIGVDGQFIGVPVDLVGYAAARAHVARWMPITSQRGRTSMLMNVAMVAVTLGSGGLAYASTSKPLAVGGCAVFIAVMGYSLVQLWNSTALDLRTRKSMRVFVPLMMLWVVVRVSRLVLGQG